MAKTGTDAARWKGTIALRWRLARFAARVDVDAHRSTHGVSPAFRVGA
jgi:hypothetical protein